VISKTYAVNTNRTAARLEGRSAVRFPGPSGRPDDSYPGRVAAMTLNEGFAEVAAAGPPSRSCFFIFPAKRRAVARARPELLEVEDLRCGGSLAVGS